MNIREFQPDRSDASRKQFVALPAQELRGEPQQDDPTQQPRPSRAGMPDPCHGCTTLPVVARVHIDSIEGGRIFSPTFERYVYPQTVGQMTVRGVYKGSLKRGTQQNCARNGAIVSHGQYWHTLNPAQQVKILHLNNGRRPTEPKYVHAASRGTGDDTAVLHNETRTWEPLGSIVKLD